MIKPKATTPTAASALSLFGFADWRLSFCVAEMTA